MFSYQQHNMKANKRLRPKYIECTIDLGLYFCNGYNYDRLEQSFTKSKCLNQSFM